MSSMGMNKSGTQVLPSANTWTKVTSFVVRSGYPATSIVNSTLVMDVTGLGNIRFRGEFESTTGTKQFRVVKNGVTVLGTADAATTTTISAQSVVAGDTLELQGFTSSTISNEVQPGAGVTFLEYNQTSSTQNLDAAATIGWSTSASLALTRTLDAAATIGWTRTAELGYDYALDAAATIGWNRTAEMYLGQYYDLDAAAVIGWNRTAEMSVIPTVVSPPSVFQFADVAVSVHTVDGRMVGDFPCTIIQSYNWGREATEVSTCSLEIMTQGAPLLVEELRPLHHWVTVWHDEMAVWSGPIQTVRITKSVTTISARDLSTFMWRTRLPITRTFTDTSPARIADVLWRSMNQLHGMRTMPTVLPGVSEDTFTLSAVADSRMLHQFMDELVKVGLVWTVVSGRPILGRFPTDPVAELHECDFLVDLERRRDGTQLFNDVRVQGQNWAQTVIVEVAGLHLQTLVSLDDMFGAANIQRAAQQYVRDSATFRDELVIPANASLHPQAPVTMEDLMPGKVFLIHYESVSQLMRLDQVSVAGSSESFDVQVTFVTLENSAARATFVEGGSR